MLSTVPVTPKICRDKVLARQINLKAPWSDLNRPRGFFSFMQADVLFYCVECGVFRGKGIKSE